MSENAIWPLLFFSLSASVITALVVSSAFRRSYKKAQIRYLSAITLRSGVNSNLNTKNNSLRDSLIIKFQGSTYGEWFKSVAIRSGLWDEADYLKVVGRKGELSIALFALMAFITRMNEAKDILLMLAMSLLAFFIPDFWIYNRAIKRSQIIEAAIPETIELLNMCVRAGLGFQAGLQRIAQTSNNPLSEEFNRVLSEIRLGASRSEAFMALSNRLKIESLKQFVNSILQVDRLGIPIAKVLEDLAIMNRNIQRDKAREQAQKVPVKILGPIMLFLLPALLVIVLGPAAITIMKVFA